MTSPSAPDRSTPQADTLDYYRTRAHDFFTSTVGVDMTSLHEAFLSRLPAGARILDAGCGSGRDARVFAARGYVVTAFDASETLARLASEHCGFPVTVRRFDQVEEVAAYDGVWACASLLHVPLAALPDALGRLWRALRPGGCLYVSFKLGQGERSHEGRHFTDADDATLRGWLQALPAVGSVDTWVTPDRRPGREESWLNAVVVRSTGPERRLVTGGKDPLLPHLSHAMAQATQVDIAVAFITTSGLRLLLPDLRAAVAALVGASDPSRRVRILTSDYLDVTEPEALRRLLPLQEQGAQVRVHVTDEGSFHLKAYLFARCHDGALVEGTGFVGSSNLTSTALQEGLEWNYRIVYPGDDGFLEARSRFDSLFDDPRTVALRDDWIDQYEQRRVPPPRRLATSPLPEELSSPPTPSPVQEEALVALAATRQEGFRRGLVVLATGLGKTWLAAFDAGRMGARRVLFVAHREEILDQAAATFRRLRPGSRVGFYRGQSRDVEVDVLCASVQTLARAEHLKRFSPAHFDYIVIDEFHHASAATYRRLLAHFTPTFLLGLTATPDRTDRSDILSLCDGNLVFTCSLFEGISAHLLAPFHYYGIFDESVDYREIPWRNGRFDIEELTSSLATTKRAEHVLAQWKQRAQKRTLAFCVSIRHAEYMAAHFNQAGIRSAAVYGGSAVGRAEALEQLRQGELSALFSVDLFNEGVDLPGIDTVMMLRPTESKILFLQQLGRGLRLSDEKQHLVALDFIGNHHSFFHKPQALLGIDANYTSLATFARQVKDRQLDLPEGCFLNYDLELIRFLESLNSTSTQSDYEALRASLGRRPTLTEFYVSGASIKRMRDDHSSWFELVAHMRDLEPAEDRALGTLRGLLRDVEITAMTKSFKMVLLQALLELDGLTTPPTLGQLAARSWEVLHRRPRLLADLTDEVRRLPDGHSEPWLQYWRKNPVNAWTGSASTAAFRLRGDHFQLALPVDAADVDTVSTMLQELVDYRLASYEARLPPAPTVATTPHAANRIELPYFPDLQIACGHFRTGRTDAREHRALPPRYGQLDPQRHFIARATGHSMDGGKAPIRDGDFLLMERDPSVSAGSTVAIERQDEFGQDQYLLRTIVSSPAGGLLLRANNPDYPPLPATEGLRVVARWKGIIEPIDLQVGQSLMREDIPAFFGETFNTGSWQAGHVVLHEGKTHVLLVTLSKQGKAKEHRYQDRWGDDRTFHWQSQNQTTPESSRGQAIIHHQARGIAIHLFVRETKLTSGKGAPFVYQGRAQYQSHQGSGPMSVVFTL